MSQEQRESYPPSVLAETVSVEDAIAYLTDEMDDVTLVGLKTTNEDTTTLHESL